MSVTLELPDDIGFQLLKDREHAEPSLMLELAISLYAAGKMPPGRAAELAGMGRWEFQDVLVKRDVEMPYTQEMIEEDIRHAHSHL